MRTDESSMASKVAAMALVLIAALVAGCTSTPKGEAPSDTAYRRTSTKDGLRLTTEVESSTLATGRVKVAITLTSVSDEPITWLAMRFGVSAQSTATTASPDGVSVGVNTPYGPKASPLGPPLTLKSGESTHTVMTIDLGPGTWHVIGAYFGNAALSPSGRTLPITCAVR